MAEYLGWETEEVEVPKDQSKKQAEYDAMFKPLATPKAVEALEMIKNKLVKRGIANPNDTQIQVGLRQGRLDMIMDLLDIAERLNNGRS